MIRNDANGERISDIENFNSAVDGQAFFVLGQSNKGDRTSRLYYYDSASTATVNGDTVVNAIAMGVGRFLKTPFEVFYSDITGAPTIPTNNNQLSNGNGFLDQSGVRASITVTNTGTGSATYNPSTGVLNIPGATTYTAGSGIVISLGSISVDPTVFMSVANANSAIASMQSDINGKASQSSVNGKEDLSNKQNSLSVDLTNTKYPTVTAVISGLSGKLNVPSGTTLQYLRGDGSLATFPSIGSGTVTSVGITGGEFSIGSSPVTSSGNIMLALATSGVTADTYSGVTVNNKGIVTAATKRSFNNAPGRSLTTSTGASGFQVSSTRDASVNYSVTIGTTVTLTGNAIGTVVLEICSTNSATAGDWIEIARSASGQSGTLVVGLVLNQTGGGQIGGIVPAGFYSKVRTINSTGTPTFTMNSQQEVLL